METVLTVMWWALGLSLSVFVVTVFVALIIIMFRKVFHRDEEHYEEYDEEYDDDADEIDDRVQAYRCHLSSLRSVSQAYVNSKVLVYENALWDELEDADDVSPGFEDETEDQMVSRMTRWEVEYEYK